MPSKKRLNSVCHSIAHHAVSGLSYIHPHILRTCRDAGISKLSISLLDAEPCPPGFIEVQPLRLSLTALKNKFESILASEGFSIADISKVTLTFSPDINMGDDYCSICHATLTSNTGQTYEHIIDCLGKAQADL